MNPISFTVVIPTFNRVSTIDRAVCSVLRQTHKLLDLVIVDDGSTDGTADYLRSRFREDARCRVIEQTNAGAPTARNRGARAARSTYLAFLDSDDEVDPSWLATLADAASTAAVVPRILTCGFRSVGPDGTRIRLPEPVLFWPEVRGCFGHAGTFAVQPALFDTVGGYTADLPAGQNTELSHRLLREVTAPEVATVNAALMTYYRDNEDNIRGDDGAVAAAAAWQLSRHADLYRKNRRARAAMNGIAGVRFAKSGDVKSSRRFLLASALAEPWSIKRLGSAAVAWLPGFPERLWRPTRPR